MDKFIDISFNGVTNSMPDDSCAPGDVSMAFGLTSEAYVSTALQPKQTHLYGIDGCDILLVHKGNGYENVFIYDPADAMTRAYRLADLLDEDTGKDCLCETEGKPVSTAVIGNVVVLCFDGQTTPTARPIPIRSGTTSCRPCRYRLWQPVARLLHQWMTAVSSLTGHRHILTVSIPRQWRQRLRAIPPTHW